MGDLCSLSVPIFCNACNVLSLSLSFLLFLILALDILRWHVSVFLQWAWALFMLDDCTRSLIDGAITTKWPFCNRFFDVVPVVIRFNRMLSNILCKILMCLNDCSNAIDIQRPVMWICWLRVWWMSSERWARRTIVCSFEILNDRNSMVELIMLPAEGWSLTNYLHRSQLKVPSSSNKSLVFIQWCDMRMRWVLFLVSGWSCILLIRPSVWWDRLGCYMSRNDYMELGTNDR